MDPARPGARRGIASHRPAVRGTGHGSPARADCEVSATHRYRAEGQGDAARDRKPTARNRSWRRLGHRRSNRPDRERARPTRRTAHGRALRGLAPARRACASARLEPGPAAARRAYQPSRHLDDRMARRQGASLPRRSLFVTHDRSFVERSPRGSSTSIEASCAAGRRYRNYLEQKAKSAIEEDSTTPSSTRSSPKRRSGFARASRLARRATKDACARSRSCARSVLHG